MEINTPDWVKDAVFYQIFPDRFAHRKSAFGQNGYPFKPTNLQPWGAKPTYHGFMGGDLLGIIDKLDYLADLGINAIYLNPIFASASNHRYHAHDYYQVDPILGGNMAFFEFLHAAHDRGIRVVLDGVFNHASRGFFQFNHLLECGAESPYVDWFHVHGWPINAYDLRAKKPNYDGWWGNAALPEFNTDTTAVREFLWGVATHWLEQGIDGWRLDVPNEIDDDAFWQEFRRRVKAINPEAYIVGELWQDAARWLQGDQFDAQMDYNFTRAAFGFFAGDNMDQRDTPGMGYGLMPTLTGQEFALELDRLTNHLYHAEVVQAQMTMLGSHDTPRLLTIANNDKTAVRLMLLCQMTYPGAPNIYYGDEIGMTGHADPDCRRAFPWHDESVWDRELLADVRAYVHLRHEIPALRRGTFEVLYADANMVAYQRRYQQGEIDSTAVIVFNRGTSPQSITCPVGFAGQLPEKLANPGKPLTAGKKYVVNGRSARIWAN
ncbi:MAG: glycoside hydrolase family 13 protein [Ardenticatenaceae bacterium]|nr:glycoside hydrolase family 13 protein [Anaerolineales bacterium]MCB8923508.1 glycoside hydrolase family 13 protein [Ardenticatenaceae bacterium]MCB9003767.1 glycoside hydrolase family 13 protein [Ardenticatenaceae bacterium]